MLARGGRAEDNLDPVYSVSDEKHEIERRQVRDAGHVKMDHAVVLTRCGGEVPPCRRRVHALYNRRGGPGWRGLLQRSCNLLSKLLIWPVFERDGALRAFRRAEAACLTSLRHCGHFFPYLDPVKRTQTEASEAKSTFVLINSRPGAAIQAACRFPERRGLVVAEFVLLEALQSFRRRTLAHRRALKPTEVLLHRFRKVAYNPLGLLRRWHDVPCPDELVRDCGHAMPIGNRFDGTSGSVQHLSREKDP